MKNQILKKLKMLELERTSSAAIARNHRIEIGAMLRRSREKARIPLRTLAVRLGVSATCLSHTERNKPGGCRLDEKFVTNFFDNLN